MSRKEIQVKLAQIKWDECKPSKQKQVKASKSKQKQAKTSNGKTTISNGIDSNQ